MKKYCLIYSFYGKRDGKELSERFTFEDTLENRLDIIDEYGTRNAYDNEDSFIKGEIDSVYYDNDFGDWDEPTGFEIKVVTMNKYVTMITEKFHKDLFECWSDFNE